MLIELKFIAYIGILSGLCSSHELCNNLLLSACVVPKQEISIYDNLPIVILIVPHEGKPPVCLHFCIVARRMNCLL